LLLKYLIDQPEQEFSGVMAGELTIFLLGQESKFLNLKNLFDLQDFAKALLQIV
jgi:hypothetical protein